MIANGIVVSAMVLIAIRQLGLVLEGWGRFREGDGRDQSGVSLMPLVDLGLALVASLALSMGGATIFGSRAVAWVAVWGLALWIYAAMALGAVVKWIRGQ